MANSRRPHLRLPVAALVACAVALAVAGPASAHIDPEPTEVVAGTKATVGFTVEHGCGDSPTTKVEIQAPDGSTEIAGVDGGGFTSSVTGQVVTFTGGPLGADTEQTFQITFVAPDQAGEVPVKIVQTCEQGTLDWIEVPVAGEPEPEHPAPMLAITPGEGTGTTGPDRPAETTTTTDADERDEAPDATTTTEAAADRPDGAAAEDDESDEDDGSSVPWIVGGVVVLVLIGGGVVVVARSRKGGTDAG